MFYKNHLFVMALALTLVLPFYSNAGLKVDLGPFNFHIGGGIVIDDIEFVEDPICQAIRETDLVELFLVVDNGQGGEGAASAQVSRLVVEPYTLGYNDKGELILRGYQIEGFEAPKDTATFPKRGEKDARKGYGFVGGMYTAFKGENVKKDFKIRNIENIRIIENSDFVIRNKSELGNDGDSAISNVICTIAR